MPKRREPTSYQMHLDLYRPQAPETSSERPESEPTAVGAAQRAILLELAAVERHVYQVKEEVVVRTAADIAAFLIHHIYTPFDHFNQEELWLLLLNTRSRVTHAVMQYRGTVNMVNVRVAELFREAVHHNATAIVVSHCHPSGDPSPSPEDVAVTHKIAEAGALLNVEVIDHIVVGKQRWVSLRERGLGFG